MRKILGAKSKAVFRGLVCDSCQENINFDRCMFCGSKFMEEDIMYCIPHSQMDSEHMCIKCCEEKNE